MTLVVFTSIFGGCDAPKPAPVGADACVCFTDDQALVAPGWELRYLRDIQGTPRRKSRIVRCSPHVLLPGFSIWVWIDASCHLYDLPALIDDARAHDLAGLRHPDRANCRDESAKCVSLGYRTQATHETQMREMEAAGYPFDQLTAGHLTWRRNTYKTADFGDQWMGQIFSYGNRDQCSLDYAAWLAGLKVAHLRGHYRNNPYFRYDLADHRRRRHGGA